MSDWTWRKFLKSQAGVAMIEFAIALPILIVMVFGTVELTRYILINQKLDKATNTMDDLATRMISVDDASMNQFTDAMPKFLRPYNFSSSDVRVVFTFVRRDAATGNNPPPPAKVTRQYSKTPGAIGLSRIGHVGGNATIQGFTLQPKENVIVVESFYNFRSILGDAFLPSRALYKVAVMRPRIEQSFCPTGCRAQGSPPDDTSNGCFQRPVCAPPPCNIRCPTNGHPAPGCDISNCPCPHCIHGWEVSGSYFWCHQPIPFCPCPTTCQNPDESPDPNCPALPLCCKSCYFSNEPRPPGCETTPVCQELCDFCPESNVQRCAGSPPDCDCSACPHQ